MKNTKNSPSSPYVSVAVARAVLADARRARLFWRSPSSDKAVADAQRMLAASIERDKRVVCKNTSLSR